MAQTYKMMLGTSGKQWEQLTVKDDGTMMLYFHGTNQSVTQEVTVITEGEWKGWLRSEKGSMWPGLESGRWNKMEDGRGLTDDGRCKMEDGRGLTDDGRCKMEDGRGLMADVVETTEPAEQSVVAEPQPTVKSAEHEPLTVNPETLTMNHPRPRRQRKPRKPRVERQTSDISHQTSSIDHQASDRKNLFAAVGMVAAASVALFVIYETGLLIPLGLIGLATGGILK